MPLSRRQSGPPTRLTASGRSTAPPGPPAGRVAAKVQQPGTAESLVADLSMLKRFSPIMRAAPPHLDVRDLFTERREWFVAEADYLRDADEVQRWLTCWPLARRAHRQAGPCP
ncbi:AarF/UbiB family protein [Geodermatophilus ruber]|uniref:AarF/UbiB family protein n=1 Tax=Geodermatophilus ruber TaxID=504800 RepID=UPI000B8339CC